MPNESSVVENTEEVTKEPSSKLKSNPDVSYGSFIFLLSERKQNTVLKDLTDILKPKISVCTKFWPVDFFQDNLPCLIDL